MSISNNVPTAGLLCAHRRAGRPWCARGRCLSTARLGGPRVQPRPYPAAGFPLRRPDRSRDPGARSRRSGPSHHDGPGPGARRRTTRPEARGRAVEPVGRTRNGTPVRREAGQAKDTVVMNAGIAPGVTNLLAAQLLEENPGADEAELVFTVTAKGTGGAASADFAHRGFTGQGHHRVKQVALPEPFGSRRVLGFAEPDGGWLGADGRRAHRQPLHLPGRTLPRRDDAHAERCPADLEAAPGGAGARPAYSRGGGQP